MPEGIAVKLDPGERSVLAYFQTNSAAEACAERLKALGASTQVDVIGVAADDGEMDFSRPTQDQASLTNTVNFGYDRMGDDDARILLAADPAVSGMSGAPGPTVGRQVLLTVLTTEEKLPPILAQIERDGGRH